MDIMPSFTEKAYLFKKKKTYIMEFLHQPFLITKMFT